MIPMIILALIVAIAVFLFWGVLQLDIPGMWKFVIIFIEMIAVSQIFIKKYKLPSEIGLVLIKGKKGIDIIDSLARHGRPFRFLSDVGTTIAYGLSSIAITRKNISFGSVVIGLALLLFLSIWVAPNAFFVLFNMLNIGSEESVGSISQEGMDLTVPLVTGILVLGGLLLFLLFGIIFYGMIVLERIVSYLLTGSQRIFETDPGGTLLLPGVNLPLFEGIIALTIVMIMHEGAHAVLARIAKIPIQSSGIVLFGIIPVGAFVEPDEEKLAKTDDRRQTRVLVAGCTSNLITSAVTFLLFAALVLWVPEEFAQNAVIAFLRTTLGLTFALNFIVGAINLLPLPVFDGYRLMEVNVKNGRIVKALMYITLLFFILNFSPWLFRFFV